MKKLIIPIVLAAMCFTVNVDASYEDFKSKEETAISKITASIKESKVVSLEDAITLVESKIANYPQYSIKLVELLKIHEKNLEEYGPVKRKVDNNGNHTYVYSYGTPYNNPILSLKVLDEQYDSEVDIAIAKVKKLYFDIVETNRSIDIEKIRVEQCKMDVKASETKHRLGTVTKGEVYSKEATLASAEANKLALEKTLDTKLREFKFVTDLDKIHPSEEYKLSLDNLIQNTKDNLANDYYIPVNISKEIYENHITLENLYQELKDKEEALKKVTEGYSEDSIYYYEQEEKLNLPLLRDRIKEAESNLTISYKGDQEKLKNKIDYFQQEGEALKLARKKYEESTIKYNGGQLKYGDYLGKNIEWIEAQKKYENAVEDIYLAVDNFNLSYSA